MIKIILTTFLLFNLLKADSSYEIKLIESIMLSLYHKDMPIRIYADEETAKLLQDSHNFKILTQCNESVKLLIGKNFQELPKECQEKPLFSTNYREFKNNKNSFGAFYWRKGRPQLKFMSERVSRFNLTLTKNLRKYTE